MRYIGEALIKTLVVCTGGVYYENGTPITGLRLMYEDGNMKLKSANVEGDNLSDFNNSIVITDMMEISPETHECYLYNCCEF